MGHSKRERRQQSKDPYESMDILEANAQCGSRRPKVIKPCPRCEIKVALHCEDCRIAVTACLCSEYKRFGGEEAWQRAVARWGEEAARERVQAAGLWLPPQR